ncbi:hypothetical protein R6Q59_004585 [Mikania micrantha]
MLIRNEKHATIEPYQIYPGNLSLLNMEVMMGAVLVVLLVLVAYGWRFFNWVWLRPKAMEKSLREQGLTGNCHRFFFGDLKEMVQMTKQAKLKPIKLTDSIVPRVRPFNYSSSNTYCCMYFSLWLTKLILVCYTGRR